MVGDHFIIVIDAQSTCLVGCNEPRVVEKLELTLSLIYPKKLPLLLNILTVLPHCSVTRSIPYWHRYTNRMDNSTDLAPPHDVGRCHGLAQARPNKCY